MQSVSYFDAWDLWWSGASLNNMTMGGIPFVWWGRIGKFLQYVGGVVVILDLIGHQRLKNAEQVAQGARAEFSNINAIEEIRTLFKSKKFVVIPLIAGGAFAACVALALTVFAGLPVDLADATYLIIFFVLTAASVPAVIYGTFALGIAMGGVGVRIIAGMLFLLHRAFLYGDQPGHPARWAAFLIVTTGFHLDILAS